MNRIIEIDGSYLEGGGQIIRNTLSLSAILKVPVRVSNIRANRPNPGMNVQLMHGVSLLARIVKADVRGCSVGATELEFTPKDINSGAYKVNTNTAASITLIYQMVMPVLLFADKASRVEVCGGTNVSYAPPVDYMQKTLLDNLKHFGINFDLEVQQYGFYPKGNGLCVLNTFPLQMVKSAQLVDFGQLGDFTGCAYKSGNLPKSIVANMIHASQREIHRLWRDRNWQMETLILDTQVSKYNGAGITMSLATTTGCSLGTAIVGAKKIDGLEIGVNAISEIGGYIRHEICVDTHMQDQLIIYMALANGRSSIRTGPLTKHTRTAIFVVQQMTGVKFDVESANGANAIIISCDGLGIKNRYTI